MVRLTSLSSLKRLPFFYTFNADFKLNQLIHMKNLLFIPLFFVSQMVICQTRIGKFMVAENDFPETMPLDEAMEACADLGDGWRLPTMDELNLMYLNKDKIGGFTSNGYWSSTENDESYCEESWRQDFDNGKQAGNLKDYNNYVRAVRADSPSIIGKPIRIGNLEVARNDFPNKMLWDEAMEACANLGDGWRLPTMDELNLMYENKDKIGGFAKEYYWNSTVAYDDDMAAMLQNFDDGLQTGLSKDEFNCSWNYYLVRCVRDF